MWKWNINDLQKFLANIRKVDGDIVGEANVMEQLQSKSMVRW